MNGTDLTDAKMYGFDYRQVIVNEHTKLPSYLISRYGLLLGREINHKTVTDKTILLYIYDEGTVEKRTILDY